MDIDIPFHFTPREYQRPLLEFISDGGTRAVACWHRRAGKDKCCLNLIITEMFRKVGVYYYFLPTYKQGRKIIWEGIGKDGFKFLEHLPPQVIHRKNDQEMFIETVNGSILRIIGSDNYDAIVGTNPIGCVFSEYALQNPLAWEFIRPILAENDGWAVFISTPRGKNHLWDMLKTAEKNDKWFSEILTVKDTGVISEERIQEERDAGMDEDLVQQEFYCSFEAAAQGAYYSTNIKKLREDKRFCAIPTEHHLEVNTAWDLGIDDATAIIFFQIHGKEIRIIDYEEHSGEGLEFYADLLRDKADEYKWKYGTHYMPHDISVRELSTGRSRLEIAQEIGIDPILVAPKLKVEDGIQAARRIWERVWVNNTEECEYFLDTIAQYHKEYDEKRRTWRSRPMHDWTSHCADAFRTLAVSFEEPIIDYDEEDNHLAKFGGRLA